MELTMSMFATQADYWQARAEAAEQTVQEIAKALGCSNDNEAILAAIADLCRDIREDFCQGWNAAGGDKDTGAIHAADYEAKLKCLPEQTAVHAAFGGIVQTPQC